jgi:hypothetical protein
MEQDLARHKMCGADVTHHGYQNTNVHLAGAGDGSNRADEEGLRGWPLRALPARR